MDSQSTSLARHDRWGNSNAYEPYVGRWSRLVAAEFVRWLDPPVHSRWLDVGCGTGALMQAVLDTAAPLSIYGLEPAAGFVSFARARVQDRRAHFIAGDARALAVNTASYDAVISGLVLNFVPQPLEMVHEMVRVAKPAAIVALYVWDYADKMEMMRHFWDAAAALDPAAGALDEGPRFPLCQPGPLGELFEQAGLGQVQTRAIDIPMNFNSFDDFWSPFLGGAGPGPGYVASLSEAKRAALRERIRAGLPVGPDGSIALIARAWAVRGVHK